MPKYTDVFLDQYRMIGDPEVDLFIVDLMQGRELRRTNEILANFHRNGQHLPSGLPPALVDWVERTRKLPSWADRERIDRGCEVFVDYACSLSMMLAYVSLIQCYAAADGAKALHATDRMGYSGADRRLGETAQFVLDVMTPGGLFEGGGAIPVILKVRLMHAAARYLIQESGWDETELGVPANVEDLLGTLMVFGYTPITHLPALGVDIPRELAEDFLHTWNVIGVLLGIPEEVLPANVDEAQELMEKITERHHKKSPEGIELTRALLQCFTQLLPGNLFDGLIFSLTRYLVGNETADLLEIPHSKWSIISEKGRILGKLIQGPQKISVINHVVNKMGWAMLTHGTHHFAGGKTHFQIPTEIRRAWRLPPLNASARIEALMPDLVEKIRQSSVGMADEHIKGLIAKTAVLMAQADGEVDDLEIAVLKTLFQSMERGHRTEVELNKAIDKARAEISAGGYESYVDALAGWAIQAGCLKEIISLSVAVAYANSGIAEEERQMITALGAAGEMEGDDLATLIDDTRMQIESIELETESNDSVNDQFVTES